MLARLDRSKELSLAWAVAAVAVIGYADYLSGPELTFGIFYLGPILVVAWVAGLPAACGLSIACALVWQLADFNAGQVYSHPALAYWNAAARLVFFFGASYVLTELKSAQMLATTDVLTGIPNRRSFLPVAHRELARLQRYGHPFTIAYIDVDNFKAVNDQLGHQEGDALLRETAAALSRNVRSVDVVARMGGDEFAVLLFETPSAAGYAILRKLQSSLSQVTAGHRWPVTFSVGAITVAEPFTSIEQVMAQADKLMYEVKRGGKNSIRHEIVGLPAASRLS